MAVTIQDSCRDRPLLQTPVCVNAVNADSKILKYGLILTWVSVTVFEASVCAVNGVCFSVTAVGGVYYRANPETVFNSFVFDYCSLMYIELSRIVQLIVLFWSRIVIVCI